MTNSMETEVLKTAQAAASQSDRVLFMAMLIVLGVFTVLVLRYLTKQNETLVTQHTDALMKLHEQAMEVNAKMIEVVSNNSVLLTNVSNDLRKCPVLYPGNRPT